MKNTKLKGTFLIIVSTVAFGIMPTISQLAVKQGMNLSSILFYRFLIATIILWIYIFLRRIPYKTTKEHFLYLMLIGILGYAGTSWALYAAYGYISGSLATILLFTHPSMIAIYEMFVSKTGKDIPKILSLLTATVGMVFVVWDKNMQLNMSGVFLSLLAAICYSFYALGLGERRTKQMHSIVVTGYVLFFATFTYFIKLMIQKNVFLPNTTLGWFHIFALAIFCTVVATITFCKGVQLIGPSTAVIISTFEPVFACVAGFFIVGDKLTSSIITGGILIVSAIFILQIPNQAFRNVLGFENTWTRYKRLESKRHS
ncbi:EamA family transporter [Clostridiaceae bacterium 35-E11]